MFTRKRAVGAELTPAGTDFRVWAPDHGAVSVVLDDAEHPLEREADGHFSGVIASAKAGTRYRFRLDDDEATYPDPASRFQPDGPHGHSAVVDPKSYEWGDSINFDGDGSGGVREFFAENAAYWIDEFHLDGLRLDATQSIDDASEEHVLTLIARRAREAANGRPIFIVAENEPQDVKLIDSYGLDALWNDDWHHAAMVAATGFHEAYYT